MVLAAARDIPCGATVSYGELARRVQRPGAARAVGGALRENPFPLIIPCHRIVRADGRPGGFGGATEGAKAALKRRLIDHERRCFSTVDNLPEFVGLCR
jgi:methylated-DNA-[protein]-cysteine S-methyltransferase